MSDLNLAMFFWSGSRPNQLKKWAAEQDKNPLPSCPESPNCINLSVEVPLAVREVFHGCIDTLDGMNAVDIMSDADTYTIEAEFRIPILQFRDDVLIQLDELDASTTLLHIRSSSRIGYSDLGVNRRRVRRFLQRLFTTLELGEHMPHYLLQ